MEKDNFSFGGIKFKGVGSKPLVHGVDAGEESVGGMIGRVGAVEVIGVGMKVNFWVVGKDLEHWEEVNVKKEITKNRTLRNTMGDGAGGDECDFIVTVEERLEM